VIEDCCQSFGARINGKQTGAIGDSAGYSFFPSKTWALFGDGGLVVTNSDETAAKSNNCVITVRMCVITMM